jgi:hypothetical protein
VKLPWRPAASKARSPFKEGKRRGLMSDSFPWAKDD